MKFELAVEGAIIADLFLPDHADEDRRVRKQRLHRHVILFNPKIGEVWEEELKTKSFIFETYKAWLTAMLVSQETIKMVPSGTDDEDGLIYAAKAAEYPIVVGEYSAVAIQAHPGVLFCDTKTFSQPVSGSVNVDQIKEIEKQGGRLKEWFSIFETPLSLEVKANQSADLLAKYLSYFYRNTKTVIIQDLYFIENEENFNTYILPHLPEPCQIILIISITEGKKHKKRLEQKYQAIVKCYDKEDLHEGFIQTDQFKINIGYRLNIFGSNGKTRRETISIRALN